MSRHFIFCLMGKSAAGKDTIYRKIRERLLCPDAPSLKEVVPYTTRPIREGEENGVTYYFETDGQFAAAKAAGKIIESRDYQTVCGIWHYYTKDDGQIDLQQESYLVIGTLESFLSFRQYFGRDAVVPLYIELDDGERLQRALDRERREPVPRYAEMCRRFLADAEDFSEENLRKAGITKRFRNEDAEICTEEVWETIIRKLEG